MQARLQERTRAVTARVGLAALSALAGAWNCGGGHGSPSDAAVHPFDASEEWDAAPVELDAAADDPDAAGGCTPVGMGIQGVTGVDPEAATVCQGGELRFTILSGYGGDATFFCAEINGREFSVPAVLDDGDYVAQVPLDTPLGSDVLTVWNGNDAPHASSVETVEVVATCAR